MAVQFKAARHPPKTMSKILMGVCHQSNVRYKLRIIEKTYDVMSGQPWSFPIESSSRTGGMTEAQTAGLWGNKVTTSKLKLSCTC